MKQATEWWERLRILNKSKYQPKEIAILKKVQSLYTKRGLGELYKDIDLSILAFDEGTKKLKNAIIEIDFESGNSSLVNEEACAICRDIKQFINDRFQRFANSAYPNDPTNIFCYFLIEFTHESNLRLGLGKDIEVLKKVQKQLTSFVGLLNDLTIDNTFTNEPDDISNIYNLFQNIIVQHRGIIDKISNAILKLTAKDHFEKLYIECNASIAEITRLLTYLPSDIETSKNFSVTKYNSRGIVNIPKDEVWKTTRIGMLLTLLLETEEFRCLYPNNIKQYQYDELINRDTEVEVSNKLSTIYTPQNSQDEKSVTLIPGMENVFASRYAPSCIDPNYSFYIKGQDDALETMDQDKKVGLKTFKHIGLHKDLQHIAPQIVQVLFHSNDLALCTLGVKFFLEKLVVAFGDFGAYVFGKHLNKFLLHSLDTTVHNLIASLDDVRQEVQNEYIKIKRIKKHDPDWKNNFAYYSALIDKNIERLYSLSEQIGIIQTEIDRVNTKRRLQEFNEGMKILKSVLSNISARISPQQYFGLSDLEILPGITYAQNNTTTSSVIPKLAVANSNNLSTAVSVIEVIDQDDSGNAPEKLNEEDLKEKVKSDLKEISKSFKSFLKEYPFEINRIKTIASVFTNKNQNLFQPKEGSSMSLYIFASQIARYYRQINETTTTSKEICNQIIKNWSTKLDHKLDEWVSSKQ